MTQDERGGMFGTYSSGVKMTLKAAKPPTETTGSSIHNHNQEQQS